MIKKVLITGGAGYVGTRLSNYLVRRGYEVTILDSLIYGVRGLYPEVKVIEGDIRNIPTVKDSVHAQDAVFHLAAISNDPTGNLDPDLTYEINFESTRKVLNAAKNAGVQRFIFASSSSVMGIQEGTNITESRTPNPITPYSKAKLQAEKEVLAASSRDFICTALRPATICGVSPRQRFDLVINALTGSAFFDQKIIVYGGRQRRPNLTMDDMLRAYHLTLISHDDLINGEVFHIGWDNMSIMEMAQLVSRCVRRVKSNDTTPIIIRPAEDMRDYHISSEKIEKVLDFHPLFTLEDMIHELIVLMEAGFITDYTAPQYHNLKVLMNENRN